MNMVGGRLLLVILVSYAIKSAEVKIFDIIVIINQKRNRIFLVFNIILSIFITHRSAFYIHLYFEKIK